jgi:DNA-binding MarR family transcriptional regulator
MSVAKRRSAVTSGDGRRAADPRESISAASRKILDGFRLEDIATHLLRRAHFAAEEMFAKEFANESITPRQKAALVMLYQQPGLSQNALADRLFMDRNTVAEMVRRLASSGLIRRMPARNDRRAYELFLAPGGAGLLDRVMPRDMLIEQKMLERLPAEYRPLFIKCVRLIVEPPVPAAQPVAAMPSRDR